MTVVLLFSLFLSLYYASTTNYLRINKHSDKPLSFNIQVNGINYFPKEQRVPTVGSVYTFPFRREYKDPLAVVFSEYSEYPGLFVIDSFENNTYFDSAATDFYIVNQCAVSECDLAIKSFGNWSSYRVGKNTVTPSVSISVNGVGKRIDVAGSWYRTKINKDDVIKIATVSVVNPIGLIFTTTAKRVPQGAPIKWFNSNLATQMLVPSVYFSAPVNNVTLFEGTKVAIELVSYPADVNSDVYLNCEGQLVKTKTVQSNTKTPKTTFTIPKGRAGQVCYFSNGGLNTIYFTIDNHIPRLITFAAPKAGSNYTAGTNVPIKLVSQIEKVNFTVKLTCDTISVTRVITSNVDNQKFLIPSNFHGNDCRFEMLYPKKALDAPSISVNKPNIAITLPRPGIHIPAGSNTPIIIKSDIEIAELKICLDCGRGMTKTMTLKPNILRYFSVPIEFCTVTSCSFSVVDYPSYFNAPAEVNVIITPPVIQPTSTQTLSDPLTMTTTQPQTTDYLTQTTVSADSVTQTVTQTANDALIQIITVTVTETTTVTTVDTATKTTTDTSTDTVTQTTTNTSTYSDIQPTTTPTVVVVVFDPIPSTAVYYPGTFVPIKLGTVPKILKSLVTVHLTCGQLSVSRLITANVDAQDFLIPEDFNGDDCVFDAESAVNPQVISVKSLPVLSITAPKSILFGHSVPVRVDTSGPGSLLYNLKFWCECGSHVVERLTTGKKYDIVPTGVCGKVEITASAAFAVTAKVVLHIIKSMNNQPPAYTPARLPEPRKTKEEEGLGDDEESGQNEEENLEEEQEL